MTAADQIAELNRQRAEQHRVVDQTYDARIRMIKHECEVVETVAPDPLTGILYTFNTGHCKHCGAPMQ